MMARERYLAMLSSWAHWAATSDAIVLLAGDGEERVDVACRMMAVGPNQMLVITGGLDDPPYSLTARKLRAKALGLGVAPSKIVTDGALNTHEQAEHVVALAKERGWKRLSVVASPDHIARAHLTFVKVLDDAGLADSVCVMPVTVSAKWGEVPAGRDCTRLDLLTDECAKVERYAEHVATWERGVGYLLAWEGRA